METNHNIYSERIKAGARTYYIDIKKKGTLYFVAMSELRKFTDEKGIPSSRKSTLFVFPWDLSRFVKSLSNIVEKIKELVPAEELTKYDHREEAVEYNSSLESAE